MANTNYCNVPWASRGEYGDKWYVMSFANTFSKSDSKYVSVGPGLNAYLLDRLGKYSIDVSSYAS
jgi:hypothetical protein